MTKNCQKELHYSDDKKKITVANEIYKFLRMSIKNPKWAHLTCES